MADATEPSVTTTPHVEMDTTDRATPEIPGAPLPKRFDNHPVIIQAPGTKIRSGLGRAYDGRMALRPLRPVLGVLAALACTAPAHAQARAELQARRVAAPPKIDGLLDDQAWLEPPLPLGPWLSYNPLRGDTGPERTEVRVAYDDRYLYFAFHCISDDPSSVRTAFSRRDGAFNDDWIGLSLDSTGAGQSSYHLFVNPSGVQMDAINTTAAGERFEADFVWYSAGRRTSDGYAVEIALPLETIRFARTPNVTMGVLFWRHVSRSGMSYSWPDMPPGQWVFNRHARLLFPDLVPRRLFELLPSATLPLSQTRASADHWNPVDGKPDLGLSAKYGVTSNVTVDATVNPDFSQVESDAFQVQVNQRYPIFYAEKRPFFMEGIGLFSVAATGGDSNMRTAVHTRRIVDPAWGAKVTGTADRLAFGFLQSLDTRPAPAGDHALFSIGRATYSLGESNYVGAIVTDTEQAGRHNRVAGGDLSWRPTATQGISASYLFSSTGTSGSAAQLIYSYETRRFQISPLFEHYDRDFQMDTAFYRRTGFTAAYLYSEVNFYPKWGRQVGLIRIHPLLTARYGEDRVQGGTESPLAVGVAFDFTRQGFLRVQYGTGHEPWAGRRFRTGDPFGAFGGVQLFRWLNAGGNFFYRGWATFYDPTSPFQGRSTTGGLSLTWQPTAHFNQSVSYDAVRFNRADTGARVFTVDIVNAKTVYQFNRQFLLRLLEQHDSSQRQLLTDVLASYELIPGTVAYAGYGSLFEEPGFQTVPAPIPPTGRYVTVSRGLFFKVSYLHRF